MCETDVYVADGFIDKDFASRARLAMEGVPDGPREAELVFISVQVSPDIQGIIPSRVTVEHAPSGLGRKVGIANNGRVGALEGRPVPRPFS
jgi:hypothetical protein